MTLKNYLWFMGLMTALLWGIFAFILYTIDPTVTNWLGFLLFYVSLFLALSGTATIIGFFIRFKALKHELIFRAVQTAFRQSFLFAFLIVAVLFLLSQKLFTWLNLFLLIAFVTVFEFLLISYHNPKK
jgi:hypothetical protein